MCGGVHHAFVRVHACMCLKADLNQGKEVEEEELDWIMANADGKIMESSGGIRKTELIYALSLWCLPPPLPHHHSFGHEGLGHCTSSEWVRVLLIAHIPNPSRHIYRYT